MFIPHNLSPRFQVPLALADMGSLFVGGRDISIQDQPLVEIDVNKDSGRPITIDPTGQYHVEHMYCQFFAPASLEGRYPLLLWHGGGMTGATYESTPDGRPGWLSYFLHRGWKTYLCDAVERGRSGWAPRDHLFQEEAPTQVAKHYAFERYRLGPSYASGLLYPGSRFPIDCYDQFIMQFVPRWTNTNHATVDAYAALLEEVGPSVIVGHSQGASLAFQVMARVPHLVKALVAVEPYAVAEAGQIQSIAHIPVLMVLGDRMEEHPAWAESKRRSLAFLDAFAQNGGKGSLLDLPAQGIHGNSHMMMMENNNYDIADMIQQWLESQGLTGS